MKTPVQKKRFATPKTGIAKIKVMQTNAGSCSGVKYPCMYHCKKCIFETMYYGK
jgi:hypothetical protein